MGGLGTAFEQRRAYQRYVEEAARAGLVESLWERLEAQVVLGGAEFVARLKATLRGDAREQPSLKVLRRRPAWEQVVRAVEAVKSERWVAFRDRHGDWGRDMALYVARRCCGTGLKALALAAGGLDYGSVATALQRFGRKLERNPHLREIHDRIRGQLS
jgi:hypothetical protein